MSVSVPERGLLCLCLSLSHTRHLAVVLSHLLSPVAGDIEVGTCVEECVS
jgi:hypothetical protein